MNYSNEIPDKSTSVNISLFGGLNRRLKTSVGEFSDMENMGHGEYPCLSSIRKSKVYLEPGVEIVKHIIPKRSTEEITGFTGIAKVGGKYRIYFNGVATGNDFTSFTDAVDFNGTIITFPEFEGYNYFMKGESSKTAHVGRFSNYNSFTIKSEGDSDEDYTIKITYSYSSSGTKPWEFYEVGQVLAFYGFVGDYEKNNTIYPETSQDYSDTDNPVSITVSDVSDTGYIRCIARNCKGKRITLKDGTFGPSGNNQKGYIRLYVPKFDCCCIHNNRLWIGSESGEMIQASALGSAMEFYELGTLSTDSWYTEVGTPGGFTGIASWHNRVLAFKDDWIHVIYGTEPLNYSLEKSYTNGCVCRESIATAGNSLIWLSHDGFYEYMGSVPKRISDKLNTKYASCVAFSDTRRYYARCVKEDGSSEFLIFDTETGLWTKISDCEILGGDSARGKAYFWDSEKVYAFGEGEFGDFYAETPPMTFDSFRDKSLVYLQVRCVLGDGAFLNVYTAVGDGEWIPHRGIEKSGRHRLPIRYMSGDTLRIRFEGNGEVHITDAELVINSNGERS